MPEPFSNPLKQTRQYLLNRRPGFGLAILLCICLHNLVENMHELPKAPVESLSLGDPNENCSPTLAQWVNRRPKAQRHRVIPSRGLPRNCGTPGDFL
jgi:hypothetical protein